MNLLEKLNRKETIIDSEYQYLRLWLKENDLIESKRFVCWNSSKAPINAKSGNKASLIDSDDWNTFDYCLSFAQSHKDIIKGVGLVLGIDESNRFIVCINVDKAVENFDVITDITNTIKGYTEVSTSKNGIHIITFANHLDIRIKQRNNISFLLENSFVALTGTRFSNAPIIKKVEDESEDIACIYNRYVSNDIIDINSIENEPKVDIPLYAIKVDKLSKKAKETLALIQSKNTDDKFSRLYNGEWQGLCTDIYDADRALCEILAFWCKKDKQLMNQLYMSSKLMRPEWLNQNGKNYGNNVLESAIGVVPIVYQEDFNITSSMSNLYTKSLSDNSVAKEVGIGQHLDEKTKQVMDFDLNDTGNARRFSAIYSQVVKYNTDDKCFMVYKDNKWQRDNQGIYTNRVIDRYVDMLKLDMQNEPNDEIKKAKKVNVEQLCAHYHKKDLLCEIMHQPDMETCNSMYDKDNNLLNTSSGIIDLKNNKVLACDKKYNQTLTAGSIYSDKEPVKWIKFLNETFGENAMWVRKFIAYCLSGNVNEQIFLCLYGVGNNGKTVFTRTLNAMLGEYCSQVPIDMFTGNGYSHSEQVLSEIVNKRLIITSEPDHDVEIKSGFMKQITGDNLINARKLYGNPFQALPHFKIIIETNPKPTVNDDSDGFYRRARFVKCSHIVPSDKINIHLTAELAEELPEILGMAVRDYQLYLTEGLEMTESMKNDWSDYKLSNSFIADFIENQCVIGVDKRCKPKDLFNRHCAYALEQGVKAFSKGAFYSKIQIRFDKKRFSDTEYFIGIDLKPTGYFQEIANSYNNVDPF